MTSLIIVTVLLAVLTALMALRGRGKKMPQSLGVIVCGAVAFLFLAGSTAYLRIQNQRLHDQCIYNVSRSDGNRQQWLDLGAYLTAHEVSPDAVLFITQHLDINLPSRTVDDCPKA
jgi:hypothetical protein